MNQPSATSPSTAGSAVAPREFRLLIILAAIIITSAVVAEVIAVKLFQVPIYKWLGSDYLFTLTAGSLVWPMVFLTTDTINEFYGRRAVKFISWLTAAMIVWMFIILQAAIAVKAAVWCEVTPATTNFVNNGNVLPNGTSPLTIPMDQPFSWIFGQSIWIIIGSLLAFILAQLVDVRIFHMIRRRFAGRHIWARAAGSTIVSQLIDSFVVIFIAFWLPTYIPGANPSQAYSAGRCFEISRDSFIYKVGFAVALTPLVYLAHYAVERWVGRERAHQMAEEAARSS